VFVSHTNQSQRETKQVETKQFLPIAPHGEICLSSLSFKYYFSEKMGEFLNAIL